jgi:hypothetical protein
MTLTNGENVTPEDIEAAFDYLEPVVVAEEGAYEDPFTLQGVMEQIVGAPDSEKRKGFTETAASFSCNDPKIAPALKAVMTSEEISIIEFGASPDYPEMIFDGITWDSIIDSALTWPTLMTEEQGLSPEEEVKILQGLGFEQDQETGQVVFDPRVALLFSTGNIYLLRQFHNIVFNHELSLDLIFPAIEEMIESSKKFLSPSLEVYYKLLRDYYMRRLPKLLKKDDLNRVGVGEGRFWCEGGRRTSAL